MEPRSHGKDNARRCLLCSIPGRLWPDGGAVSSFEKRLASLMAAAEKRMDEIKEQCR
jgi:hypothetical protein